MEERSLDHRLCGEQGHPALQHSRYQSEYFRHDQGVIDDGFPDEQTGRPFFATFPSLSNIYQLANGADSIYHGLQVTLRQNSTKGMYFVAGYTWAHAIDTSGSNRQFNIQNSLRPCLRAFKFRLRHSQSLHLCHDLRTALQARIRADARGLARQWHFHRSGRHTAFLSTTASTTSAAPENSMTTGTSPETPPTFIGRRTRRSRFSTRTSSTQSNSTR